MTPAIAEEDDIPRRHFGLLVATAVVALIALLFALPNILTSAASTANGADGLADAKKITDAMRDKADRARRDLAKADCNPDGRLSLPDGTQGDVPPPPVPIRGADDPRVGGMPLVGRRASESVVFVFTCGDREVWEKKQGDDKTGKPYPCPQFDGSAENTSAQTSPQDSVVLGSASGFFVGPKTVVTNFHVVRDAKAVFVTNRFLGKVARATVRATTTPKVGLPDFGLLEVNVEKSPPPIPLATAPSLLENVVAAGFPGVITDVDDDLEKLFHGDALATPGLTTFPGSVTLIKYPDEPVQLIFSSAVIGHGNSGGPLLDLCARAIGMNTLGWSGKAEDTGYKVNIAQGAKALAAFLDSQHVSYLAEAQSCQPAAQADLVPPPTAKSPDPVPAPPIEQKK